jgi:hypothetical protein
MSGLPRSYARALPYGENRSGAFVFVLYSIANRGGLVKPNNNIHGWPTVYILDHHGIIRHRFFGFPGTGTLDTAINAIVQEAERVTGRAKNRKRGIYRSGGNLGIIAKVFRLQGFYQLVGTPRPGNPRKGNADTI